jgi:hypothetical protein
VLRAGVAVRPDFAAHVMRQSHSFVGVAKVKPACKRRTAGARGRRSDVIPHSPINGAFTVIVTVFPPRIERPASLPSRRSPSPPPRTTAAGDSGPQATAISRLDEQNNLLGTYS